MEKIKEFLLMAGIVIFAVLLYLFMPGFMNFITEHSKGTKGLVFLGLISLVLIIVFFLFGYRKTDLLKIALLIIFIAAMVWLYFNYRDVDMFISSRYGQGVATIVFFAIILLILVLSIILI